MTDATNEADQLLQLYWRSQSKDMLVAADLRNQVLSDCPLDALTAGRCLTVLGDIPVAGRWEERVNDFREHATRLITRCHQIDQLGDKDTEPEALFEILSDDAEELSIEAFDAQSLRRSRIGKSTRASRALAFLGELGWQHLPEEVTEEIRRAANFLEKRAETYQATALFAGHDDTGLALGVQVARVDTKTVTGYSQADLQMTKQAEGVLTRAYSGAGAQWSVEWEMSFGGNSIGLALAVAALVEQGLVESDPLLAATGRIEPSGKVRAVGNIAAKVRAAVACGFRRLLVPAENLDTARDAAQEVGEVSVIAVQHTDELRELLAGLSGAVPLGVHGTIRYVRKLLPLYGLDLVDERILDHGYRLAIGDATGNARIDVYQGRRGVVRATGSGTAFQAAQRLIGERLASSRIQPRPTLSLNVPTTERRERLVRLLQYEGAEALPTTSPYETWRYRLTEGPSSTLIIGYTSGRVVISNGQTPAHDTATRLARHVLDGLGGFPKPPEIPAETAPDATAPSKKLSAGASVSSGHSSAQTKEAIAVHRGYMPHIGTDEAGKGDYFGPLVCAACYVDAEVAETLQALGVRDSKKLTDKSIRRLAKQIRAQLPGQYALTPIPPKTYNELYTQFRQEGKNLNTLMAWGHARSIENLLSRGIKAEYAVVDKFADERYMESKLLHDTRQIGLRLDQRTKAESDIAVAAASILARDAFVAWLDDRSSKTGWLLPKGAGEQVVAAARRIVAEAGPQALGDLAKISFKTTNKVLGDAGEHS